MLETAFSIVGKWLFGLVTLGYQVRQLRLDLTQHMQDEELSIGANHAEVKELRRDVQALTERQGRTETAVAVLADRYGRRSEGQRASRTRRALKVPTPEEASGSVS